MSRFVFVALAVVAASAERGGSPVYTSRIDDPKAQYLAGLSPRGNDTAALQADIDKVEETTGEGILFIPEGRYRISQTVCVAGVSA